MSKYRIEIRAQSGLRSVVQISWLCGLLLSIWSWKVDVITYQLLLQILGSLMIIGFGGFWLVTHRHAQRPLTFLLSESGKLTQMPDSGIQWQVSSDSKLVGPFVYLQAHDRFNHQQRMTNWLAKDQFIETDFRRLCRVICRCQRANNMNPV
ncbi:protein YgfX [Aliiglaciecola litoralis]|uniref:protein YgfX n=1 Tax=Aliiglaciecola litoralis TaxID=582857 RepID=UPI0031D72AC4